MRETVGQHLHRGVELHRARAERDHRRAERQVARLEPAQVAQHFGLGMVRIKDGMGQVGARAAQIFRPARLHGNAHEPVDLLCVPLAGENRQQRPQILARRRFIERDGQRFRIEHAQVDADIRRALCEFVRAEARSRLDSQRVEERRGANLITQIKERDRQPAREQMHPLRNGTQALRPVINRVH
jgi:hypothetical protein